MASPTFIVVGGVAIIGIGMANLLSAEFARKLFYRHGAGSWGPTKSEKVEKAGVGRIRFVLGPALIVVGYLLVMRGWSALARVHETGKKDLRDRRLHRHPHAAALAC